MSVNSFKLRHYAVSILMFSSLGLNNFVYANNNFSNTTEKKELQAEEKALSIQKRRDYFFKLFEQDNLLEIGGKAFIFELTNLIFEDKLLSIEDSLHLFKIVKSRFAIADNSNSTTPTEVNNPFNNLIESHMPAAAARHANAIKIAGYINSSSSANADLVKSALADAENLAIKMHMGEEFLRGAATTAALPTFSDDMPTFFMAVAERYFNFIDSVYSANEEHMKLLIKTVEERHKALLRKNEAQLRVDRKKL